MRSGSRSRAVWADLARLRAARDRPLDVLALFTAPLAGSGSRLVAAAAICALPLVAYGLVGRRVSPRLELPAAEIDGAAGVDGRVCARVAARSG